MTVDIARKRVNGDPARRLLGSQMLSALALWLAVASVSACGGQSTSKPSPPSSSAASSTPREGTGGSPPEVDAGVSGACTGQSAQTQVTGTLRGSRVDAVVRDGGVQTFFVGPGGSATSEYAQSFNTVNAAGKPADGFVFSMPMDVVAATLEGWAGATAAEAGTYPAVGCGGFTFEMRFPTPPGIVCPSKFGDCGPDCDPSGEAGICLPGNPKVRYGNPSASPCSPLVGDWQLQLTSVCPAADSGSLVHFVTHGHLTATLTNEADATDTVVMNLDF